MWVFEDKFRKESAKKGRYSVKEGHALEREQKQLPGI